jgi:hypothetical protein
MFRLGDFYETFNDDAKIVSFVRNIEVSLNLLPNHSHDPVGLKALIIAAQSTHTGLDVIQNFLNETGVPYDTLIGTQTPLVSSMLWDGVSRGYFQGILLTTGSLENYNGTV